MPPSKKGKSKKKPRNPGLSEHADEYIDLRFNKGASVQSIMKYAEEKYGEHWAYNTWFNWFKKLEQAQKEAIQVLPETRSTVQRYLREKNSVMDELEQNLDALRSIRRVLLAKLEDSNITSGDINALSNLLKEIRQTVETIEEIKDKLQIEKIADPRTTRDIFISVLADIPNEYKIVILKRLEEEMKKKGIE